MDRIVKPMRDPMGVPAVQAGVPDLQTLAERINTEHEHCANAMRAGLHHALEAGRLLLEAKAGLPHGAWLPWLHGHCRVPERTAQVYMRLARDLPARLEGDESATVADLTLREALALLATPREPANVLMAKVMMPEPLDPQRAVIRITPEPVDPARAFITMRPEPIDPPATVEPAMVFVREPSCRQEAPVASGTAEEQGRRRVFGPYADQTEAREEQGPSRDDPRRTYQDWSQLMTRLKQWDQESIASTMDPDEAARALNELSPFMGYLSGLWHAFAARKSGGRRVW